jgi:rod shape-determining protein MreD
MSTYLIGTPLLLLAAILDASLMIHLRYQNGQASLLLLLITAWALQNDLAESLPWAIIGGIWADLLSVTPLGASSLAFTLALIGLAQVLREGGRENFLLALPAVLLTTLIYQGVVWVFLSFSGWSFPPVGSLLTWMLPSMGFNLLLILPSYWLMRRALKLFRAPQTFGRGL